MTAHAGCRPSCTSYHAADCPVAHPGAEARLRAALRRITEVRAEEGFDLECVEAMRAIAEEALRA